MQAVKSCFVSKAPPRVNKQFQPKHYQSATRRHHRDTPFISAADALYRSAIYSGAMDAEQAKSGRGFRVRPLYAMDRKEGEKHCKKLQNSPGNMSPGVIVRSSHSFLL